VKVKLKVTKSLGSFIGVVIKKHIRRLWENAGRKIETA